MTTADPSLRPVGEIVDRIDAAAAERDELTLQALLRDTGERSFLPALMLPALLVVSPLSGIPLFSSLCGLSIAFVSGQMLLSHRHLWLPRAVRKLRIDAAHTQGAIGRLRQVSDWLDRHARRRLRLLTARPFRKWSQALCFLCGSAMPFLELVPFSSSLLGGAVLLLATGLLARDGVFTLLGNLMIAAAVAVPLGILGAI
ncbi:exopolysaccharide biosynthesis protein [Salipiger sp. P9]|uniref:exopolysaccharide biosynthesis protein n=1 Tax=Salipiger pentaromativorans TaxID=2943193 RepID=UPI002158181C|nr:exopolysaccharide biosynthesis protein [Salipiger pentaromativorans]MCR8549481.1 exopolysaccharide biosynthesis protein [Salipiger pentaromativorans]